MQSPRDTQTTLIRTEILPGLIAFSCPSSGGIWIDVVLYWDWFRTQPEYSDAKVSFESPQPASIESDTDTPLISPRTGRIMRKCKVGSGLGFRIDFEPSSGFWLDKGEYESLLEHNLHDQLHLICSPEYQLELIRMQTSESEQQRFERSLGKEVCEKIHSFAAWFAGSRDHQVAMTYLHACIEEDRDRRS
jgi:Zn-finger nucleic acid-binding protein